MPQPPLEKPYPQESRLFDLVSPQEFKVPSLSLTELLKNRKSRRAFKNTPLSLNELSFLLWSTQGIKEVIRNGYASLRTVPSAGARHAFETYLYIRNVEGLEEGVYRYLPIEHKLLLSYTQPDLSQKIIEGSYGQHMAGESAVTFIWSVIPYRMEWRYAECSYKLLLLDAGHVCQNLYLACENINCGTCAIGAYSQKLMDSFIKADGKDEFVIYMAPVGKY